ncbi:MAG: hypothetical protein O9302_03245 [Cyclobacteriaceae bacterium]|jgi:hypothetical protein|nr:hypothetical protein [Cytophagales bacterium]MCZ8327052.1 hypothetical protein [Cyclobacteriaceae bacterium]
MDTIEQIFDNIGRAITSLAAVIFVMLMTISGMIFFSHTLFIEVFPSNMQAWEKLLATWLMALGWEFTVLITTCNTRHINKNIPIIMAVASGIIVLFFIQAFDGTQAWLVICQRWFVGILAATINYIYAELFYAKWQERQLNRELPNKLHERDRQVNELDRALHELHVSLDETQRDLYQTTSHLNETQKELHQLKAYKQQVERELTCPHCKVVQESYGTLQAHKGHCAMNERRRKIT